MRLFAVGLALAVAIALPLDAQQSTSPLHAEQSVHSAVEGHLSPTNPEFPAAFDVAPQAAAQRGMETGAVRQASARNFFAVIGVVVVAVALFTLFR
jgi:hypothetical protein